MSTNSSTPDAAPHPLWLWLKRRPLEALPMLGFLIAIASFVAVAFPAFGRGSGKEMMADLVAQSYVLIWMLVATLVVRTVGIRQVMTMFLSGFFLATTVSLLLGRPVIDRFGMSDATVALWVPIVEELAKIIPLILMLWAYSRRRGQAHGVSELMVMGFAIGSGMAAHEDIMYGRTKVSVDGSVFGSFTEPWGAIFPTFYTGGGGVVTGHSGWGAVIGLGLALASVYHRRRILAACFATGGVLVAIIDHAASNMRGDLTSVVHALSLNHTTVVAVLAVGFPLAIAYDVMRRRHRPPPLPRPGFALYRAALTTNGGVSRMVLNFFALGHYRRGWTAAAYDRATSGSTGNDHARLVAWYRVVAPVAAAPASSATASSD